jgi:hypothetical protein
MLSEIQIRACVNIGILDNKKKEFNCKEWKRRGETKAYTYMCSECFIFHILKFYI